MEVLFDVQDLRRSLLDYLSMPLLEYIVPLDNKALNDKQYWAMRTKREYNIPHDEFEKLLQSPPYQDKSNQSDSEDESDDDVVRNSTPFDIYKYIMPKKCSGSRDLSLPGCDISNEAYQLLPEDEKLNYPLAKYNFVLWPTCKYIFARGKNMGMRCPFPVRDGGDYCRNCRPKRANF